MNIALLESFGQNYPEENDGQLDTGSMAIINQFNRHGTLLAVGCNDGRIVVYDFLTRGIAKVYQAHTHTVCSLSWSRNGKRLISAATDNLVCIWDVTSGECIKTYRFPTPVMKVQFAARNDDLVLVCPLRPGPVLVQVKSGKQIILPELEKKVFPHEDSSSEASFDRRGKYIYTGNPKGRIAVIDANSLDVVASFRVTTGSTNVSIKEIQFARKGESFLVNTADRTIRVYDGPNVIKLGLNGEIEPIQKLQDLINKASWKKCCFSGDGEYICAGSAKNHQLIIWEKRSGCLVKLLQGLRGEQLLDVVWHPIRPILCSISSGVVSVWAQNQIENWSAFAPDFTELDENVEYEERENEFDDEDEDKSDEEEAEKKRRRNEEQDVEIDVTTCEPIRACLSSDEEEEDKEALHFLPISPEIDDPEENTLLPHVDATSLLINHDAASTTNITFDGIEGCTQHDNHPVELSFKNKRKRPTNPSSSTSSSSNMPQGRPKHNRQSKDGKSRKQSRMAKD